MEVKKFFQSLLPRNSFARNVSLLVGGAGGAQVLGVLVAPVLTRLYTTEDFGLLAIYASLLSLFSVIACLRYELAIPLPEDDLDAAHLTALGFLLILTITFFSACMVWIGEDYVTKMLRTPQLKPYLWLLPLGVFFSGLYGLFRYWSIRNKAFGSVAKTSINQAIVSVFIQLACYKFGGASLLFAQAANQSVGAISLGKPYVQSPVFRQLTWVGIKKMAIRYKHFPCYSTWEGLFNAAGTQLPPLFFAIFFSPAAAGLYSLANRVLSIPMWVVGGAIGQVFLSSAAEARRNKTLNKLVLKLHSKLANFGLAPALLIFFSGPEFFSFVFSSDWREAGEYARWMSPWLYFVFTLSPLSTLFAVTESQKEGLAFQVVLLVVRLGAIFFGVFFLDAYKTIILFSVLSTMCWLAFLFWVGSASGNTATAMLKPTFFALGPAFFCCVPLLASFDFLNIISYSWFFGFSIGVAMIAVHWVYMFKRQI